MLQQSGKLSFLHDRTCLTLVLISLRSFSNRATVVPAVPTPGGLLSRPLMLTGSLESDHLTTRSYQVTRTYRYDALMTTLQVVVG